MGQTFVAFSEYLNFTYFYNGKDFLKSLLKLIRFDSEINVELFIWEYYYIFRLFIDDEQKF